MNVDDIGFYHSRGERIELSQYAPCHTFFRKVWCEDVDPQRVEDESLIVKREHTDSNELQVVVAYRKEWRRRPVVVICLGGPIVPIPNVRETDSIYQHFLNNGFVVVVPLRRGVIGTGVDGWEYMLEGHYGEYDIQDTCIATDSMLRRYSQIMDENNIFLYGGSYGGYVAMLMAGRVNSSKRFKAIIAHCGVYNLAKYPYHSQGEAEETMQTYGNTTDVIEYNKRIACISPNTFVGEWNVPVLLIHHLYDTSTWMGQSVEAYNDALNLKNVKLMIVPAPHSYAIERRKELFMNISSFFTNNISYEK
ncbi:MAG: alpha/beta hydrolase family protein [Prevotella sp.]